MEMTTRKTLTRSRFFRLVGVRDEEGRVVRHAPAIFTEDQWGDWRGVLHQELVGFLGQEMLVSTPVGHSRCLVEDTANGQTLLIGRGPAPF